MAVKGRYKGFIGKGAIQAAKNMGNIFKNPFNTEFIVGDWGKGIRLRYPIYARKV